MPLQHDLFFDQQFGGLGIAQSWIERAQEIDRHPNRTDRQFDRFLALWLAFNAWGACVTLAGTDAIMIRELGRDEGVNSVFDCILEETNLKYLLSEVEHNFPLPSFTDLLRLDPLYDWRGSRNEAYWQKIASAPPRLRVRLSPPLDHNNLIWADVLSCTYKIRCNLVHGGKMASPQEARFVGVFADLLDAMLTHSTKNVFMLR